MSGLAVLPADYGGAGPGVDQLTEHWCGQMERHKQWLLAQTSHRTIESLRTGKNKIHSKLSCSIM